MGRERIPKANRPNYSLFPKKNSPCLEKESSPSVPVQRSGHEGSPKSLTNARVHVQVDFHLCGEVNERTEKIRLFCQQSRQGVRPRAFFNTDHEQCTCAVMSNCELRGARDGGLGGKVLAGWHELGTVCGCGTIVPSLDVCFSAVC